MFEVRHVKYKSFMDIESLKIDKNIVTSILGTSGSGKTTLLKMLNKMVTPDSGEILYNGESLSEKDAVKHRREVVMLSQTPAIFEGTVEDNLQMGLKFSEKPLASKDQMQMVLEKVNLKKSLDSRANQMSGGEKQRLALARVILMAPKVLLLDEPSSSLDEDMEIEIIKNVVDYAKESETTLIMVTHAKKIAYDFSDEIVFIEEIEKGIPKKEVIR